MPDVRIVERRLPVIAIVGRPNVGKSTLFNRLVRSRRAIVDDAPGVTRDRVVAEGTFEGRRFCCVDTGGFLGEAADQGSALEAQVRDQALHAIRDADVIVCVVDGTQGWAPFDDDVLQLLRASGKPVVVAVNKIDGPTRDGLVTDFHRLGVDALYPISSAHGRGVAELIEAALARVPVGEPVAMAASGLRLALMGRPNVGKSSLLNRLLGVERVVVSPVAGTTRDAVDTAVTIDGHPFVLIDTAGIRRRTRVDDRLERHGAVRALETLGRSDIVIMVIDATEGMTDQDARLVGRAWEAGRGVILLVNKWDMVPHGRGAATAFHERIVSAFPAFTELPWLCASATTGEGLDQLLGIVRRVERSYTVTLRTPVLNRAVEEAVAAHAPPSPKGRAIRLLYAAQTGQRPPEVTIFASAPTKLPTAYTRYLVGRLEERFKLVGVPVRIRYRARRPDVTPAKRPDSGPRVRRSATPSRGGARSRRR